jgi:hypothetical protein
MGPVGYISLSTDIYIEGEIRYLYVNIKTRFVNELIIWK